MTDRFLATFLFILAVIVLSIAIWGVGHNDMAQDSCDNSACEPE